MNHQAPNQQATPPRDLRLWSEFIKDPDFYIADKKLLHPQSKIFTMGSCFALEIRRALKNSGYAILPHYQSVVFDPALQIFDKVQKRNGVFHYDTFVMRQDIEEAFGLWTDRDATFAEVRGAPVNELMGCPVVHQDPTRRMVYAVTKPLLRNLSDQIAAVTREGLAAADVIVLTLGLTEVWRDKRTGRYHWIAPRAGYGGAEDSAEFRTSSFMENYENMRAILDLLATHYPKKKVVISVSPVHLEKTYARTDVGTASTESKAILRTVAGQITRDYKNVVYYPSYEMAQFRQDGVFGKDGRHVVPGFADRVVASFVAAFS